MKCYDGSGDGKDVLTKVELEVAIKSYADEKKAQYAARKFVSPAFDVYLRLSDADKKDFGKLKEELLKEFEKGQLNRDEAIHLLSSRRHENPKSPQNSHTN